MHIYRILCAILTIAIFLPCGLGAQVGVPFNQRDDEYRLLGLKRAKSAYEAAKADLERSRELAEKELISSRELESTRRTFADAEVNYQQSLLAVLFEMQYVTVAGAVKYQATDGRKHVKLTLANASGGSAEYRKLLNIDDALFRSLQPDIVNNVYISLLNDEGAIISQPYEAKISQLTAGKPKTLDFALLQDLDAVTVNLVYGSGTTRSPKIYLQKDASVNKVIVQSEQFSQEVELGGSASFEMTLELFSGLNTNYKLEVVNLPQQINRYFTDRSGQTRLSQFKFTESANTRYAALQIFMPDRPTDAVQMDKAIPFYMLVIPREQRAALGNLQDKIWNETDIQKLNVGYVKLEVVPRGIGRLLVKAPQLYHGIHTDESVIASIHVKNEGSRRLDNVELEADVPLNWDKEIIPPVIESLDIAEEKKFQLKLTPPPGVAVGKYEARVRTTSFSENQPINGEDKTVTVEILAEANVLLTAVIVLTILGLIIGLVVFGIRLSRK